MTPKQDAKDLVTNSCEDIVVYKKGTMNDVFVESVGHSILFNVCIIIGQQTHK